MLWNRAVKHQTTAREEILAMPMSMNSLIRIRSARSAVIGATRGGLHLGLLLGLLIPGTPAPEAMFV